MKLCICCNEHPGVVSIPGSPGKYICKNCFHKILEVKDTNTTVIWDFKTLKSEENSICKLCFQNIPTFIHIRTQPLALLCAACANGFGKTKQKIFIGIKWRSIIKSSSDLCKYESFKNSMNRFKSQCNTFSDKVELKQQQILELKEGLKKELNITFNEHFMALNNHRKKLADFLKNTRNSVKNSALEQKSSIFSNLLKSSSRQKLFERDVISVELMDDKRAFDEFITGLCMVQCRDVNELIDDPCITFMNSSGRAWLKSLKYSRCQRRNLPSFIFKEGAAWGQFDNGDILYCGGKEGGQISDRSFLINSADKALEVEGFNPKIEHFCIVVKDILYAFGGNNAVLQRYLKGSNKWEKLSNTPEVFGSSSGCNTPNGVIMTGYLTKELYLYKTDKNKFEKISTPSLKKSSAKLIAAEEILYCISNDVVFKGSLEGKSWVKLNAKSSGISLELNTAPVFLDGFFYFVNTSMELCRFSTFNYELVCISKFDLS